MNSFYLLQVCCNNFAAAKDAIENHKNVALLPTSCGEIDGDRIIGGTVASLYEYPWMALIVHKIGTSKRTNKTYTKIIRTTNIFAVCSAGETTNKIVQRL